jgi:multiple sugar transport system ATP-binding protein
MAHVVLENITKTFKGPKGETIYAVKELNLSVADREFIVLVGPSGCGKSTTLRLIAGLEAVSSGTVSIDGRRANDLAPKDRDLAMVFQNYALYPHLTAYENMAFGLKLRKFPKAEIQRRVSEAAEWLGLSHLLERLPKALSGGERQRVAVGRAIVHQPKVFLFDEPLSNLDSQMRLEMRVELARLHERLAATMIYVTHDQVEAMTLGERIAVMRSGCIQQVGPPMEVYRRPVNMFVAGFIGSPPMNFLSGTLVEDSNELCLECGPPASSADAPSFRLRLEGESALKLAARLGQTVVAGFRPEDVAVKIQPRRDDSGAMPRAKVVLAEPMGADTCLHLQLPGANLVARTSSSLEIGPGHLVAVTFDLGKAHFFDPSTGSAL